MSLIGSKQQEASVSNVISANVSVMDKECWWKTSVGDGAGGKGWWPVFLFCFSVLVMAQTKFRVQGQLGIKWITVRINPFFLNDWVLSFSFVETVSVCACVRVGGMDWGIRSLLVSCAFVYVASSCRGGARGLSAGIMNPMHDYNWNTVHAVGAL